jgi:hypothetical protein
MVVRAAYVDLLARNSRISLMRIPPGPKQANTSNGPATKAAHRVAASHSILTYQNRLACISRAFLKILPADDGKDKAAQSLGKRGSSSTLVPMQW